jgi:sugar lactone lactonase YvrE
MRPLIWILLIFFGEGISQPNANFVVGQPNFVSDTTGVSSTNLAFPTGIVIDSSGGIYSADSANNRILYFPKGQVVATFLYGQPNMDSNQQNAGGLSASSLLIPEGIALDTNENLFCADAANNRVLMYPKGSNVASFVIGQGGSFVSSVANLGGISASSLNRPFGITLDVANGLYVVDSLNNRVLFYTSGSTVASRCYGQPSFVTASGNAGTSASSLSGPTGVVVDNFGNVYISDGDNRVLVYSGTSTTAVKVIGQGGSFTTGVCGLSATGLCDVRGVAVDSNLNLYVADYANFRVLMFPKTSLTAETVYGQNSFTSAQMNSGGISAHSIAAAEFMAIDVNNTLYIADGGNARLLCFGCTGSGVTTTTGSATTKPAFAYNLVPQVLLLGLLLFLTY